MEVEKKRKKKKEKNGKRKQIEKEMKEDFRTNERLI